MKKYYLTFSLLVLLITFSVGVTASPLIRDVIGKENKGITVTYNNETQILRDGNSNVVYPVVINGSTYLPVRAIATMMDCDITWNSITQTVAISPKQYDDASAVPTDLGDAATGTTNTPTPTIPTEIKQGLIKEDILRMYGNPEYISPNSPYEWVYVLGKSYVWFDKDWKVAGWMNPPEIGFTNNQSSKICIGITKVEVTQIYGTPEYISPSSPYEWGYELGKSYVWFDKEWKVIGWQGMSKDLEK